MTTAIDLSAGLGGWSNGARAAGVEAIWAATSNALHQPHRHFPVIALDGITSC